jgi:hypothetical protein
MRTWVGGVARAFLLVPLCGLLAAPAVAQQTSGIAGVVRDATGAVLPGATVEAASPALIEKVRTAVTDGQGLYNIVDLRPGRTVGLAAGASMMRRISAARRSRFVLAPGWTSNE